MSTSEESVTRSTIPTLCISAVRTRFVNDPNLYAVAQGALSDGFSHGADVATPAEGEEAGQPGRR